jgi:hypothetical protein
MAGVKEIVESYEPALLAICAAPYWACLYYDPGQVVDPATDVRAEFWFRHAFDDWYPDDWPNAIVAVVPATALNPPGQPGHYPRTVGHRRRPGVGGRARTAPWLLRRRGLLICAVAASGDAHAVLQLTDGRRVAGPPSSGCLLDAIRAKFGLPPGPVSPYTLDV